MSLLAEELVEEWLNRAGYFTIRGVKLGVHEIDLLAIRHTDKGLHCRHVEVQASTRPMSYLSNVPKALQRTGRPSRSAKKRTDDELRQGVAEWVAKKYDHPAKQALMRKLAPGPWTRELVVHVVYHEPELDTLRGHRIEVHRLRDVVTALKRPSALIDRAAGADLMELVEFSNG